MPAVCAHLGLDSRPIGKFSGALLTRCTVNPVVVPCLVFVFCLIACGHNVVEIDIDFASAVGRTGLCLGDESIPFPWRVLSVYFVCLPVWWSGMYGVNVFHKIVGILSMLIYLSACIYLSWEGDDVSGA